MVFSDPADKEVLYKAIDNCDKGGCLAGIWLPKSRPDQEAIDVVVMIHGGAYSMGNYQDVPKTEIDWLLERGFVVVSIQYRKAPHVRIPEIVDDLVDAYEWVWKELPKHVDDAKSVKSVIVEGWSAGAVATVYTAHYGPKRKNLPPPVATIVGYGPFNYDEMAPNSYDDTMAKLPKEQRDFAMKVFDEPATGGVRHPPANKDGDPRPKLDTPRLAWLIPLMMHGGLHSYLLDKPHPPFNPEYVPIQFVDSSFPPCFILVAGADKLVPVEQSYAFRDKLKSVGVTHELAVATGMPHGKCENWLDTEDEQYQGWWKEAIEPGLQWATQFARGDKA